MLRPEPAGQPMHRLARPATWDDRPLTRRVIARNQPGDDQRLTRSMIRMGEGDQPSGLRLAGLAAAFSRAPDLLPARRLVGGSGGHAASTSGPWVGAPERGQAGMPGPLQPGGMR